MKKFRAASLGPAVFLFVALGLLLFTAILALRLGALPLSSMTIVKALWTGDSPDAVVIRSLRLPRVLLAATVGAALAVSGALLQGATRNPLGSPELFGLLAGTEGGAVFALYVLGWNSLTAASAMAAVGGAVTLWLVFTLAGIARRGDSAVTLAVAGFSMGILVDGITGVIIKWRETEYLSITRWAEGSIGGRDPQITFGAIPIVVAAIALGLLCAPQLNAINLGDEAATGLGVSLRRLRLLIFAVVLILTATAVTAAGPIGFIGLVMPHIVRLFTGSDYRYIIPGSALLGAAALIVGDLCARTFLAGLVDELPITALTAAVGAPALLLILRQRTNGVG